MADSLARALTAKGSQAAGALLVGSGWPFPNAWLHPGTLRAHNIAGPLELLDDRGEAAMEVWSGLVGLNREVGNRTSDEAHSGLHRILARKWLAMRRWRSQALTELQCARERETSS